MDPDLKLNPNLRKLRRRSDVRAQMAFANSARNSGDWASAARYFAAAVLGRPDDHFLRMKQAKALANAGSLAEAANVFRHAIALKPERPEGHFELGIALGKLGLREEAIDSLANAVRLTRIYNQARRELIIAGGADRLPEQDRNIVLDQEGRRTIYGGYDAFRRHFPIFPPPSTDGAHSLVSILIDDSAADPAALRSTLLSLMDQRYPIWTAWVISTMPNANHPVRSLADIDARVRFIIADEVELITDPCLISLSAGTVLDPQAVSWMVFAILNTEATAVYADHEVVESHWRDGVRHLWPALQSMPDSDDIETTTEPPLMLMIRNADIAELVECGTREGFGPMRRAVLSKFIEHDIVAHIPRILSSRSVTPDAVVSIDRRGKKHGLPRSEVSPGGLVVVIPTRDGGRLLKRCVESLQSTASVGSDVRFLIVDNGSRDYETLSVLRKCEKIQGTDVLRLDVPFNWSRLNNLAVAGRQEKNIVFANDDTEMLSREWDIRVLESLARPRIGVVGVRLCYPDGTLQHAGLALGVAEGMPLHEGLRVSPDDGGPLDRWRRRRCAAAITGAFMAIRRDVFERVGGFDETELAVAYNDIDLCLKVRELGLNILYEPAVELIHHESVSRGQNDNPEKIAWDEGELRSLHDRWGDALFIDPARNPQWAHDRLAPFDGFRDMSPLAVARHIRASVKRQQIGRRGPLNEQS